MSQTGWTNAPLVATSQIDIRTQAMPVVLTVCAMCLLPNAVRSRSETRCLTTFLPSPMTISMNAGGYVHSTSALSVRDAPVPVTA